MPMGQPQGREGLGSAVVIIGGQHYDRFLSLTLKRSLQEACCSGTVVLSWPGAEQFSMTSEVAPAFSPGVEGAIILDNQLAGTVIFDTRISKGTPKHYELTLQFRGVMSINVDSSPDHESGQFNDQQAQQIIQQVMLRGGLEAKGGGEPIKRFIIAEGETIERMARRAAREQAMIGPWENPQGKWVIQEVMASSGGGGDLKLGRDFTQWSVKSDVAPRFTEYQAEANGIPDDQKYGGGDQGTEKVYAEDRRQNFEAGKKLLRMLIDTHQTQSSLQKRVRFEADVREASSSVTLRTSTWSDRGGKLWEVGGKYHVDIPVDGVNDSCTLSEVEFELTPDSRSATLVLTSQSVWSGGGPENVLTSTLTKSKLFSHGVQRLAEESAKALTPKPPAPVEG